MVERWKPELNEKNIQRARKVLFDVLTLFDKYSVNYHLEGGTLLGIVRDKDLLPWDYDVDVSIPEEEAEKIVAMKRDLLRLGYKLTIRRSAANHGPIAKGAYSIFKIKPLLPYIFQMVNPAYLKHFVVLDIFVKTNDETHTYWQAQGKVMRVEKKFYKSFEEIEYKGKWVRVPNDYKDYLTQKYGDWSVPVKEWKCGENEGTICASIPKKQD